MNGELTQWRVRWTIDGTPGVQVTPVLLQEGDTDHTDIPLILAVSVTGRREDATRINIIDVNPINPPHEKENACPNTPCG